MEKKVEILVATVDKEFKMINPQRFVMMLENLVH